MKIILLLLPVVAIAAWFVWGQQPPHAAVTALQEQGITVTEATGTAVDLDELADNDYILFYFSAHWCPPCRKATPELVKWYHRRGADESFEFVFVSRDRSAGEMQAYREDADMPWPAIAYEQIAASGVDRFAGSGIPHLALVGRDGELITSSNVAGRYVGLRPVLERYDQLVD